MVSIGGFAICFRRGPDEEYDVINGPEWDLSDGESGGGDNLTFGPVAPGNTYTATVNYTVEYAVAFHIP